MIDTPFGNLVPLSEYPLNDWPLGAVGRSSHFTSSRDRSDGRHLPIYETETDLSIQRAACRAVCNIEGVGVGAIGAMANYTIGVGMAVNVRSAKGWRTSPSLIMEINEYVQDFLKRNEVIGDLDKEVDMLSREDGERLLVLRGHPQELKIGIIEPEWLTEPQNTRQLEEYIGCEDIPSTWTFGIHRERGCIEPLGYHVVYDGSKDWEYFYADRAEHWKRNVPRTAARGVSDAFPVFVDIRRESKLATNLAAGAAARAAISWIEEMAPGITQSGASSAAITDILTRTSRETGQQQEYRIREVPPGTAVKIPNGKKYLNGPDGPATQGNLEVSAYLLRRFGVRWNAPEYLISGDASNGNFASTLVAESPFVKGRESDQGLHRRRWQSLLWKVVKLGYKAGFFGQAIPLDLLMRMIDIDIQFPDVASRDEAALTDAVIKQRDAGFVSDRTASTRLGNDYDQEVQLGAKKSAPPVQSMPFGLNPQESRNVVGSLLRQEWAAYP